MRWPRVALQEVWYEVAKWLAVRSGGIVDNCFFKSGV